MNGRLRPMGVTEVMFDRNAANRKSTAPPARELGERALAILAALPPSVVPRRTYLLHPLVVTRLLNAWRDPFLFRQRVDSLLLDSRRDREGFGFDVITEITALREHYGRYVQPLPNNAWNDIGRDR